MKLVFLLLVCSGFTATLQKPEGNYWPSSNPFYWLPSFYGGYHHDEEPVASPPMRYYSPKPYASSNNNNRVRLQDLELLKLLLNQEKKSEDRVIPAALESSLEGRINFPQRKQNKPDETAEDRAFGPLKLFGWNALVNYAVNSLTGSISTSTTYTTLQSTITVGSMVTCYTATLFLSTTPCRRRKRTFPGLLVDSIEPSEPNPMEASIEARLKEERMVGGFDTSKFIIESSMEAEPSAKDQNKPTGQYVVRQKRNYNDLELFNNLDETIYVTTSSVTTYSLYTSSVTRTITTNFVADSLLTCLPNCFTLC